MGAAAGKRGERNFAGVGENFDESLMSWCSL